jgi:hypothetical protein
MPAMNRVSTSFFAPVLLTTAITLLSCGGQQAEPETPAGPTPEPAAAEGGAAEAAPVALPDAWSADMTKEQKAAFMKQRVVPAMAPVFQGFSEDFADFSCETCHGPDYKLPKEVLPELVMKDGQITAFAEAPEASKFMAEQVVPAMAQALGLEPYNPETHQGFGCGGCHAMKME